MSHYEEVNEKFDRFIQDFDQKLNKDTSTLKTINSPIIQHDGSSGNSTSSSIEVLSPIKSPLLSTPTKPKRNSITLDKQPLSGDKSFSVEQRLSSGSHTPAFNLQTDKEKFRTPRSVEYGGIKRSNTINSFRSLPKKGLNLNLNINKQTPSKTPATNLRTNTQPTGRLTNLNSSVILPKDEVTGTASYQKHSRRRTNSSQSTVSSTDAAVSDDFNESLRLLALKEMRIVELKDEMKLLQQKISQEESELQTLKYSIGKDFRETIQVITNNPIQSEVSTITNTQSDGNVQTQTLPDEQTPKNIKESKRASMWAKPISFFNQFDQILQNEIEKLNKEAFPQNYQSPTVKSSPERSIPNNALDITEGNQSASNNKVGGSNPHQTSDDVLNTVSSSLWSFVSDVKHGLLGDEIPLKADKSRHSRHHSSIIRDSTIDEVDDSDETSHEQEMITIHS